MQQSALARHLGRSLLLASPLAAQERPRAVAPAHRQTMRNLLDNLEEAGMDFSQVVATNVYLDDLADTPAFDEVYSEYFGPIVPASTTVQQVAPAERKPDKDGHYPDVAGSTGSRPKSMLDRVRVNRDRRANAERDPEERGRRPCRTTSRRRSIRRAPSADRIANSCAR
jgi:Endoribonuclease L-PSP